MTGLFRSGARSSYTAAVAIAVSLGPAACGESDAVETDGSDAGSVSQPSAAPTSPDEPTPPGPVGIGNDCGTAEGECALVECTPEQALGVHVETCSPIVYATNPPSSGMHYPVWANFQVYDEAVPRGLYTHSIEHGAVVLLYNCDLVEERGDDCAELAAELADFAEQRPVDPLCEAPLRNRMLVTPDPLLDAPFAATAWGHFVKGNCFDAAVIETFADNYYGMSYEDICVPGLDPTLPEVGIPSDCGE